MWHGRSRDRQTGQGKGAQDGEEEEKKKGGKEVRRPPSHQLINCSDTFTPSTLHRAFAPQLCAASLCGKAKVINGQQKGEKKKIDEQIERNLFLYSFSWLIKVVLM